MEASQTSEEFGQFLSTEAERVGDGRCLNGWCPDLKLHYSVGRKAKKKTPIVAQLRQSGSFSTDQIAGPALPPRLTSTLTMTTQAFMDFESRVSIMDKVMEALKDDSVNMICICGAGGVGKTTMVNKIVNKVRKEKMFDEIAVTVISQALDSKKSRDEIADQLGLKLDRQSEQGRADQLHERIVKINKFLLVLDDVWNELVLEKMGLPLGLGYKILITSRRKDMFLKCGGLIREPINFEVPILFNEEAWALFKATTGNCCEAPDMLPLAEQILNECGGLPIAIVTVGSTLWCAGSNVSEWKDALQKLERGRHGDIAHSCIKLSYDYLKCEEHRGFFLLCCLFPEDADIPIETLLRYGMGLGLLTEDNYSFQEARNRVHTLVNKLSRLFLLLESKEPEHVKMHDVVRDVGKLLASEEKEIEIMNSCIYFKKHAGRSIRTKLKLLKLPAGLHEDIPLDCFVGMTNLNVLDLSQKMYYEFGYPPKLPPFQFHDMQNVRTLCLENCDLENVNLSEIGALGSLEILSFYGSHGVWLPSKFGLLTRLRLLDCRCYKHCQDAALKISHGVLSGLKQLEELYLGKIDWDVEKDGKEVVNASVDELKALCKLTTLTITLPEAQLINPNGLNLEKLVRFRINLGCEYVELDKTTTFHNSLAISIKGERIDRHMGSLFNTLLMKTIEILHVDGTQFLYSNSDTTAENLFDLLQMSLKKGFTGPNPSFYHLQSLEVSFCHKLKYVLTLNVAGSLLQLESLEVHNCGMVEEVFYLESISSRMGEGAAAGTVALKLPKLTSLKLHNLPKLTAFCKSTVAFELPQLMKLDLFGLANVKSIFKAAPISYTTEVVGNGGREAECYLHSDSSFTLLPTNSTELFRELRVIKVAMCRNIEVLFDLEKVNNVDNPTNTILPWLEQLHLCRLPKLTKVCKNGAQACQGFPSLKILDVSECESMEHIVGEGEEKKDNKGVVAAVNVLFPQLVKLRLENLQNLVGLSMKEIILDDFPNMKTFSSGVVDHRDIISHDPIFIEDGIDAYNAIEFSLERISIKGCPKLSRSFLYFSLFNSSELEEADIAFENQKVRVMYSSDRDFMLIDGVENLMDMLILDGKSQPLYFSSIQSVELKNILNFPVAWLHFLQILPMLEKLVISSCGSAEVIFGFEQGLNVQQLPQLTELKVTNLEKLTSIWMQGIPGLIQRFQNLGELYVGQCNCLRNLLTPSMAKHLTKLTTLTVENCNMVKEIVSVEEICVTKGKAIGEIGAQEDEGEEISNVTIELFPQINNLTLKNLPNLTSFCASQGYSFNWPSLTMVFVTGCPRLETFTLDVPKTPMLKEVETESYLYNLVEDLNATIQLIFQDENDFDKEHGNSSEEESACTEEQSDKEEHEISSEEESACTEEKCDEE